MQFETDHVAAVLRQAMESESHPDARGALMEVAHNLANLIAITYHNADLAAAFRVAAGVQPTHLCDYKDRRKRRQEWLAEAQAEEEVTVDNASVTAWIERGYKLVRQLDAGRAVMRKPAQEGAA